MLRKHFRDWGAVWILMVLFLGSWLGQLIAHFATSPGDRPHWAEFWGATFENWQSEFLQLAVQAVLIASIVGRYVFNADDGADKEDVQKILDAINRNR